MSNAPAIVMIHGMWGRPSMFASLRQELEAAGYQSAAVTLPGHGLPPGAPPPDGLGKTRVEDYVATLEREVASIEGPVVLLGYSLGGLLAQLLAARIQPRALILLSTAPSAQALAGSLNFSTLQLLFEVGGRWDWWKEPIRLNEDVARDHLFNGVPEVAIRPALADLTWDSGAVLRQIALPFFDSGKGSRVSYSKLSMPSLILVGRNDRVVPPAVSRRTARLLAAAGSRIDYEEWPAVGHWLFHEDVRRKVFAAICRFMTTLGPA